MLEFHPEQINGGCGLSPKAVQLDIEPAKQGSSKKPQVKSPHPNAIDRLVTEHPFIIKDIDLRNPFLKHAVDHTARFALKPDKGSSFDKSTKWFRWLLKPLPSWILLSAMRALQYDGMVFTKDSEVVGHVFWQRRKSDLHVFSVYVAPEYRGQGLAETFIMQLFKHAQGLPDVERVRIGGGKDPTINHILGKISACANKLNVIAEDNHFFRIKRC